jgi:hypothetical protein
MARLLFLPIPLYILHPNEMQSSDFKNGDW